MRQALLIFTLFIAIAISCFNEGCLGWIDSTRDSTWVAEDRTLEFREDSRGGTYTLDTPYTFGSMRTDNDSVHLYKMWSMEIHLARTQDSLQLHELERILIGTELEYYCGQATMQVDGTQIKFDVIK